MKKFSKLVSIKLEHGPCPDFRDQGQWSESPPFLTNESYLGLKSAKILVDFESFELELWLE